MSYESFFTELLKVVTIILKWKADIKNGGSFNAFLECCPQKDHKPLLEFLFWVCRKAQSSSTKEWAFYAITQFGKNMVS